MTFVDGLERFWTILFNVDVRNGLQNKRTTPNIWKHTSFCMVDFWTNSSHFNFVKTFQFIDINKMVLFS